MYCNDSIFLINESRAVVGVRQREVFKLFFISFIHCTKKFTLRISWFSNWAENNTMHWQSSANQSQDGWYSIGSKCSSFDGQFMSLSNRTSSLVVCTEGFGCRKVRAQTGNPFSIHHVCIEKCLRLEYWPNRCRKVLSLYIWLIKNFISFI